jgi:hypothetical protein
MDATPANSAADIIGIIRKRQDELNIACLTVDEIAGLAQGHYSKITCGLKGLGPMTLFVLLSAFGLRLRIEEDPDVTARLRHRWTPRQGHVTNGSRANWRTPTAFATNDESPDRPAA